MSERISLLLVNHKPFEHIKSLLGDSSGQLQSAPQLGTQHVGSGATDARVVVTSTVALGVEMVELLALEPTDTLVVSVSDVADTVCTVVVAAVVVTLALTVDDVNETVAVVVPVEVVAEVVVVWRDVVDGDVVLAVTVVTEDVVIKSLTVTRLTQQQLLPVDPPIRMLNTSVGGVNVKLPADTTELFALPISVSAPASVFA